MRVVSILNPKGGCGKTTLATNLAQSFQTQGMRVLLVDSDPQGSARDWHAAQEDNSLPLIALDRPNNLKTVASVGHGYDIVVIDGAAKLEDMIAAAVKISDAVLIPVQPSPYDIWAAADLVDLIKTRQEVADGRPAAAFVISRAIKNTKLGGEVSQALATHGFPVLRKATIQRQVYAQTAAVGETVIAAGGPAAREVNAIGTELLELLKGDCHAASAAA